MYYRSRIFAIIALSFTVLSIAAAAAFSIRLAWADAEFRRNTPDSVTRAVALLSRNTTYLLMRALQVDYDGQDATTLLERAATLSPRSSAPRIRLGLAAEARGDLSSAEKWLLDAASVDHQFEPRWTLANFYYRDGRNDDFWKWMREALAISYGDRKPAFDLCWHASDDPSEIFRRAIPERREVLADYLAYLLEQRPRAAGAVALRLAEMHDGEDVPLLYAASDSLIDSGLGEPARGLWKLLDRSEPQTGNAVVNGDFSHPPVGHGFDWRVTQTSGLSQIQIDGGAGHRIALSGGQPESCELLRQVTFAEQGHGYRLRWESRTQGLKSPTGLSWAAAKRTFPIETSDDWRKGEATLTAPTDLMALTLQYQRPSGQPRAEGNIELRSVELTPLP